MQVILPETLHPEEEVKIQEMGMIQITIQMILFFNHHPNRRILRVPTNLTISRRAQFQI